MKAVILSFLIQGKESDYRSHNVGSSHIPRLSHRGLAQSDELSVDSVYILRLNEYLAFGELAQNESSQILLDSGCKYVFLGEVLA